MAQLRTVQVLGDGGVGGGAHVRWLADGLAARGVAVSVCAPARLAPLFRDLPDLPGTGVRFAPVPPRGDPRAVHALRRACSGADLVHVHGPYTAAWAAVALRGTRIPLVVTWHTGAPATGVRGRLLGLLERGAARSAAVVLGTCSELVDRARHHGARDARLAPVALPRSRTRPEPDRADGGKTRAELGLLDRPMVMAVGSLVPGRGYDTLLTASAAWRALEPTPLVVIAGEGPERAALRLRIAADDLPVRLLGSREDVLDLLAAADVAVLTSRWEARSLLAQEALRLGVPLVATAVGGVPELVGDAAELIPYGDADALAGAVSGLLADPGRRDALVRAGRAQADRWQTEDETVAHVLSVYDEVAARFPRG
ncbi:glycosyltransferase family 4 protein [Streptomyces sp. NPDC057638]|uniref:glycosyltransferase family 4 protein n=1 Tax=Streptomyces sp. NPDC057638 TaxID=3346190 RepID=UPI0036B7039E